MPYGLQGALCHLKSTCIQAKQLQYNNDIHYGLMIFIFLHIRRFCISKGGLVPLPSDMRGSTVLQVGVLISQWGPHNNGARGPNILLEWGLGPYFHGGPIFT